MPERDEEPEMVTGPRVVSLDMAAGTMTAGEVLTFRGRRRPFRWLANWIRGVVRRLMRRLGYVPEWMVPPPAPVGPKEPLMDADRETIEDWWSKSSRVEVMSLDTYGPDNRYLTVMLRFTHPRP